jgi:hypothetical protein
MSPHLREMAEVATAYCHLIEGHPTNRERWLQRLGPLLARLHAAVIALEPAGGGADRILAAPPDLDARFELYARLCQFLGAQDGYRTEFDWDGSLADDLTDIYCELKQGLPLFPLDPERAGAMWLQGFRVHWGWHLVDASRHLYDLASRVPPLPEGESVAAREGMASRHGRAS